MVRKIENAKKKLAILNPGYTKQDLANELGISLEKIEKLELLTVPTTSLYAKVNNGTADPDAELHEFIEDESNSRVEENVIDDIFYKEFREAFFNCKKIDQKTKDVIALRYGLYDGKTRTLEEISIGYGVTRERIRQIINKGIDRLLTDVKIRNFETSMSKDNPVIIEPGNKKYRLVSK